MRAAPRSPSTSANRTVASGRMELSAFAERYPPLPPALAPAAADQLRLLVAEDGVRELQSPLDGAAPGVPGTKLGRHLWIIARTGIPFILETAPDVRPPPLSSGVAKHTNLTGGDGACCGGELWVDPSDAGRLFVNGGSGRFPPRSPQQLAEAVRVIERRGFGVVSAGWDEDNARPARVFR